MKMLLLTKNTYWCEIVQRFIEENFQDYMIMTGESDDLFPDKIANWEGDYIISFLAPWIVPSQLLKKTKIAAINFHPASPKYPGIGCYNFAIYNEEKEYGVTCHHMIEKVDSGNIIAYKSFPIHGKESVLTLKEKTMIYLVQLFYEIMDIILKNNKLPITSKKWHRKPYTKKEFKKLCEIRLNMPKNEIVRRIRATYYPEGPDYPYIEEDGKKRIITDYKDIESKI